MKRHKARVSRLYQFVHLFTRMLIRLSFCIIYTSMESRNMYYNFESKIVGGHSVPIENFPFAVQVFNYGALCGGTVLSSWAILTAAHCFNNNKNVKDMHVRFGARYIYDMSADSYKIWYIVEHEDYNKEAPFACDIALIFTRRPIRFNKKTQRAMIVQSNKWMNERERNFKATGWGFTSYGGSISNSGLMETQLRFVSLNKCRRKHHGSRLTEDMFCLYGDGIRDTCQGDSGGAILWNRQVVGLVSHGDGCAQKDKPGIYTNVYYFLPWMNKKIKEAHRKYCISKISR
ncbi:trypsin epsilon-like [Cydia pomonella]|uniref:trypsin epsilon-like n=1 Tax=Cydia pomonella TaxID=82600 RepID=UPI002ADDBE36|nr:trypsin epsilon-like [Cydia pomonella]